MRSLRKRPVAVVPLVVIASLFGADAALPCTPAPVFEPGDSTVPLGAAIFEAPPGGAFWLPLGAMPLAEVRLARAPDGEPMVLEEEEVVYRGPETLGLRVPAGAVPGDGFVVVGGGFWASLVVVEGSVPAREPPSIADSDVTALVEVELTACTVGFAPRSERTLSLLSVALEPREGLAAHELLLELWVRAPGAGPPADDDDGGRALDAFPASETGGGSDEDTVRVRVGRDGSHDVYVRLIDPLTGARSELHSLLVDNEDDRFAGWHLLGGWHWGCAQVTTSDASLALLVLLSLVGRGRRRARLGRRS